MLRVFILQHIDALITIALGVAVTAVGLRAARKSENAQRAKSLRIGGFCMIAVGVIRLCIDSTPPYEWRRVTTSDGVASVEFPGEPRSFDQTNTIQGQNVHAIGWDYVIPANGITFRISYSDISPEQSVIPRADRVSSTEEFYLGQGLKIRSKGRQDLGGEVGYFFEAESADGASCVWITFAYTDDRVYRIVASSATSFRTDPVIRRFCDSFRLASAKASGGNR